MATGNSRLFYALTFANPIHPRMSDFTLFQRDDCHLCDQALEVLAEARFPDFSSVFIDDDEVLEGRYGARVPVLRRSDGVELDWPFAAEALRQLMV